VKIIIRWIMRKEVSWMGDGWNWLGFVFSVCLDIISVEPSGFAIVKFVSSVKYVKYE
jgi:hypothetical protein